MLAPTGNAGIGAASDAVLHVEAHARVQRPARIAA